MLLDLAFRFNHEAQADAVPGAAGQQADAERARVPQRIEPARVGAEFGQALLRPGEVVGFFARRGLELALQGRVWVTSAWAL